MHRCGDVLLVPYEILPLPSRVPYEAIASSEKGTQAHKALEIATSVALGKSSGEELQQLIAESEYGDWILKIVEVWDAKVRHRIKEVLSYEEHLEKQVKLPLLDVEVTLTGKADLIARIEGWDGTFVIDYKTSSTTPATQSLYTLQPIWYAYLCSHEVTGVGILSFYGTKNISFQEAWRPITEKDFRWLECCVQEVAAYLQRGIIHKSYQTCSWCDYKQYCKQLPQPLILENEEHTKQLAQARQLAGLLVGEESQQQQD